MLFEGENSATKAESRIVIGKGLTEAVDIDGFSVPWQDLSVIARNNDAAFQEKSVLSQDYKLREWIQLNSLFYVNQFFFEPIIAPVKGLGVVAIVDDSLGQLSLSLGMKGSAIKHIAFDTSEKKFCEQLFEQHGLSNIEVLAFDSLDLDSIEIDTLILARPVSKYVKSVGRLSDLIERLIAQAKTVAVIEENKYGLRRLVHSRLRCLKINAMFSPTWWKKALTRKNQSIEFYGVVNGSTSTQMPRISLWAKGQLAAEKAKQSSIKSLISFLPFFKFMLPGFMAIRHSSGNSSWFSHVCELPSVKDAISGIEGGYVKRVLAGNRGVTVIIYGNQDRNCVWRIASQDEGVERVRVNAKALKDLSLAGQGKSNIIPSLLYLGEECGSVFSIEEMLPGNEIEGSGGDDIARDWLASLQSLLKVSRVYSGEIHAQLVSSSIERLKRFGDLEAQKLFENIDELIKKQFLDREISFVPLHGDLKEGNYLYGSDSQLSAVIDWDMYCRESFPLVDHMIQLLYQNIHAYQDDGVSIFSSFFDKYTNGDFKESLVHSAKAYNLSERDIHIILLYSLIRVIDLQFVDALKTHHGNYASLQKTLSRVVEFIQRT